MGTEDAGGFDGLTELIAWRLSCGVSNDPVRGVLDVAWGANGHAYTADWLYQDFRGSFLLSPSCVLGGS